jgi:hypothetical protein
VGLRVRSVRLWSILVLTGFLTACAHPSDAPAGDPPAPPAAAVTPAPVIASRPMVLVEPATATTPPAPTSDAAAIVQHGSGVFVADWARPAPVAPPEPGEVTLNFAEADLREVVR